jgi:hypothetical protein
MPSFDRNVLRDNNELISLALAVLTQAHCVDLIGYWLKLYLEELQASNG